MKKASVFCTQQARVKASHASTKNIFWSAAAAVSEAAEAIEKKDEVGRRNED